MKKVPLSCIVDDDYIFVFGLKQIIKKIEFSDDILVFWNGQEAIDGLMERMAQKVPLPDVIFLDLNMPIMDGWDFLKDFTNIPNHNRNPVTIFVTSSSIDRRDIDRVKNYKVVNNYIIKPVTKETLEEIMAE